MTSLRVVGIMTLAFAILAVVGLILEGPMAAYFPGWFALAGLLELYLQRRYPPTLKAWSARRIIDTTAVLVLLIGAVVAVFMLVDLDRSPRWMPLAVLLIMTPIVLIDGVGLVKEAFRRPR
jgi:hypothetical protein